MTASEIECKSKNKHGEIDLSITNSKPSRSIFALFQDALQMEVEHRGIKGLQEMKCKG